MSGIQTIPLLKSLGIRVLERGWLSSNNVILRDTTRAAIVDTGYETQSSLTLALVKEQLDDRPLDLILNTHLHSDHCGGNAALKRQWPAARLCIPPGQADAVRRWDTTALTYAPTGQTCSRFLHDDILVPGSHVALPGSGSWQICSAPGHDPHAVLIFHPAARILISGDALWLNGFGVVFPELEGECAFDEVARTLDLIEDLRPAIVIPGHGPIFAGNEVASALERARSKLKRFQTAPDSHRRHALKVLLKFKLLEWQRVARETFEHWFVENPYFRQIALASGYPSPQIAFTDILNDLSNQGQANLNLAWVENI